MSLTNLNAYQRGGPVLDKLKQLWGGARRMADDPSWGYMGASMLPGIGEYTDLVEIGAGLQDRDPLRVALGGAALALPFVAAPALRKMLPGTFKNADRAVREEWVRAQNRRPDRMFKLEGTVPESLSDEQQLLQKIFAPEPWRDPTELAGVRGLGIMHRWRNRSVLNELRGQAKALKREAQDSLEKLKAERARIDDWFEPGTSEAQVNQSLAALGEPGALDSQIQELTEELANADWEDWLPDDAINRLDEFGHPSLSRALELRLKQGIGGFGHAVTAPIRALGKGITKPWWMPQKGGPYVGNITERLPYYGGTGASPYATWMSEPITTNPGQFAEIYTAPAKIRIGMQEFTDIAESDIPNMLLDKVSPFRPEWLKSIMPNAQWDLLRYPNREYVHPGTGEIFDDFSKYAEDWITKKYKHVEFGGTRQLPRPDKKMLGHVLTADMLNAQIELGEGISRDQLIDMMKKANRIEGYDDVVGSVVSPVRGDVTVSGPGLPEKQLTKGILKGFRQGPAQDLRNLGIDIQSVGAGLRTGGKRATRERAFTHSGMEMPIRALDKSLLYTKAGVPVSDRGLKSLLDTIETVGEVAKGGGTRMGRSLFRTALRRPLQAAPLAHMASRRSNALNEDQGIAPSAPALPRLPQIIETPEERERRRIEELLQRVLRQDLPPPIFRPPIR